MMACECDPSWTAERWSHYGHLDNGGQRRERGFQYYATNLHDDSHSPDDPPVKNKCYTKSCDNIISVSSL